MGNGYTGVPALIASYLTVRAATNIEISYVDFLQSQGIGFLDAMVKGSPSQTKLNEFKTKFGDLTKTGNHSLWHDQNVEIKPVAVHSTLDYQSLNNTLDSLFCESTGANKIDLLGDLHGTRAGAETDRYTSMEYLSAIQELFEPPLIETFMLCQPKLVLRDKFALDWELEMKFGRREEANIMQTYAYVVQSMPEFIPTNRAMDWFKLAPMTGPEGQLSCLQYRAMIQEQAAKQFPLGMQQMQGGNNPFEQQAGMPSKQSQNNPTLVKPGSKATVQLPQEPRLDPGSQSTT
jgi:hypothetical protein